MIPATKEAGPLSDGHAKQSDAGKPVSVLLTGFGPFPGAPSNPSRAAGRTAGADTPPGLERRADRSHVFATSYAAIDRDFRVADRGARSGHHLMFGLAARTRHIRIETRARNLMSFFPDAGGFVPAARTIPAGATSRLSPALATRLRLRRPLARPADRFSRDAGRYVCNYVFWRALEMQRRQRSERLAAFIHVPNLQRTCRRQAAAGGATVSGRLDADRGAPLSSA